MVIIREEWLVTTAVTSMATKGDDYRRRMFRTGTVNIVGGPTYSIVRTIRLFESNL